MSGYLGRPEATARTIVNGWLDTGDLGFLHQGDLYLTGRAKDVLILRGRNHAPHEVEQAVDQVAGVRTGCAAAASHRHEGGSTESLLLFVEHVRDATADQRDAMPTECIQVVLDATGLRVDEVLVVSPGTLPRTSSGKIRRREALERHLAGELRAPESVSTFKMLGTLLRSSRALARSRR
jgi:acyl-CoA synthetase (AMP-forming)/AMP-acid ligase II